MQKKNITAARSQQENLSTWCFEVGTRFEKMGAEAAQEFISIIDQNSEKIKNSRNFRHIVELGCGDGASVRQFINAGFGVTGVDINREKLEQNVGANIVMQDMYKYVTTASSLPHIFTHHSLEHTINAPEIIEEVGKRLIKNYLFYAAVPAEDYLHSVHHIVFDSPEELLPPGCEPVLLDKRARYDGENNKELEFVCIAKKK